MGLRIVIDDAVPWQNEAFGHLAKLRAMPGGSIDRASLRTADALIVRSVTRVDAALLEGTSVRFVGSATAGEDHIDREALEARGITVAHAPGCNAQGVAEYVVSALAHARHQRLAEPPGPVGVVGLGHVGRRTTRALRALGYHVLACDPPLADLRARGESVPDPDPTLANMARFERLTELGDLLDSSFVLTLHVPLVHGGPHPTAHLFDELRMRRLRHGQLLLNTSRGGVVDDAILERWVADDGRAVIDVWEGEPTPRAGLLPREGGVLLGTPHIAGYTLEGKVAGTRMIHEALCAFIGRTPDFDGRQVLGPRGMLPLRCSDPNAAHDWRPWIEQAIPLRRDDESLRRVVNAASGDRGRAFEDLRRNYLMRRELPAFRIEDAALDPQTHAQLGSLGISVPPKPTADPLPRSSR